MKKIILGLLFFIYSQICDATTIDDLGYKSIFRNFYPTMFHISMNDDDYEGHDLPKAGIKEYGKEYLAMMYPPEEYINANNEKRYLVYVKKQLIEKQEYVLINGKWKKIPTMIYDFSDTCHACDSAKADLFIFKKNIDNKYDLIARSNRNFKPLSSYGDSSINIKDLKDRIVNIGKNDVGFFDDSFVYTSHGVTDNALYLVHLNEKGIKGYFLDLSSGSNLAQYEDNSPLTYEYSSEYKTIKDDNSEIYPVEIKFKGDAFNDKTDKIESYNKIKIFIFNKIKDKYELKSERSY